MIQSTPATSLARAAAPLTVDFYFDPGCPWAWRASLWMRELQKVRSIHVEWKCFSLYGINTTTGDQLKPGPQKSATTVSTLPLARRLGSSAAVDRLYLALADGLH